MRSRSLFLLAGLFALAALAGFLLRFHPWRGAASPAPMAAPAATTTPAHAVIGHTREGRAIDAYTYGSGPTKLLFVGGMHGGYEWNAVLVAYALKTYLDAHPEAIPGDLSVTVVPDLNVDGTYAVAGKEGAFTEADVDTSQAVQVAGRTNADEVDLNRNFDCNWQATSTWRSAPERAGTAPFSEPETAALRDLILQEKPAAVVFYHSQSGTVYAADCSGAMAPHELDIMRAYAKAAGYQTQATFDAYPVTGDAEGWLASLGIPALTVELTTHTDVEWEKNLAGVQALFTYFASSTPTQ